MKITFYIAVILSILTAGCTQPATKSEALHADISGSIRLNQLGYYPELDKKFTLADRVARKFEIRTKDGKRAYKGKLTEYGSWSPSGEDLRTGDFSALKTAGDYFIYIPELGRSYMFSISDTIYHRAANAALRTFFFQRTGMEMEEKYLGKFARSAGHYDDTCYFHPSSGHSEGFISSSKGWYDAGDYGKYVINASIATGTMLALHEIYPDLFPDGSLNIPESGNGINDMLDEIRYELDWVLSTQDIDGGVYHKLTSLWHDGITMPDETFSRRYIIGKSTAASLDFAAMMAQAARNYKSIDEKFAATCLASAKRAYDWAVENPKEYFSNPKGVGTGGYGDKILDEEFFWAAAELFCSTDEESYYNTIKPKLGKITFRLEESWRNYVDNIGYYSLLLNDRLTDQDRSLIAKSLLNLADSMLQIASTNGYDIPVNRFVWGSNSDILDNAIIQLIAHHISDEKKYLKAAAAFTDYIFGRNATAYSFVSGFGTKYSNNFHHRLFMADNNDGALPGFLAGGPNFQMQDANNLKQQNISYPYTIPAKAYIDNAGSYASNEICLNWNAPLVFVLAYLDKQEND